MITLFYIISGFFLIIALIHIIKSIEPILIEIKNDLLESEEDENNDNE